MSEERRTMTSAQLDAEDPLAGFRRHFAGSEDGVVSYLDGNSLGRPVLQTAARLADFADGAWGRRLIRSWDEAWMEEPTRVGDRLGAVALGAAPGQTVVGDSTSVLLYKLIRAAVDLDPSRAEIVLDRENFPTDRFILEGIAAERGLTLRWLEVDRAAGVQPADLRTVLSERTALVVASHVAYRSGFLADAKAITELTHDAGALILWDLSHSAGSVPVHLDAWRADLAVGCSYKYLNGGPGAPAFGYVRAGLHSRLSQPIWGWMGADDPFAMDRDYRPATGIRQFLTGTPAILAMQPMKLMLELIGQAGIEAIRQKSMLLTEHALDLIDDRLVSSGVTVASPRDPARRGSHVTIEHPDFRDVCARLWRRGVIPDFRSPSGIRIGLSPLSTTFAELELGVEAIGEELVEAENRR
ncbi:MAG: aminotransferase class V-fold PLP-dependent enzyme [Microlunatus sp.]|nr:aminotransferase class V-fold PLP-dependent enzyme [Microlunatus sp.]MDN5771213.1 aminotransferase class V-fold PLP-dependent enzyme [Microlunatus sp.]